MILIVVGKGYQNTIAFHISEEVGPNVFRHAKGLLCQYFQHKFIHFLPSLASSPRSRTSL